MVRRILQTLILLILPFSAFCQRQDETRTALQKVQLVQYAISQLYVDSVNDNEIAESAIRSMLKGLDPHSTYSTPEEVKELNEPLQGNFDGIGVQFQMVEDTMFVIQPISGGPSEKAGILSGDRIVEVDDTLIAGVKMSTDQITSRLKGPKGSTVRLKVTRRGARGPLKFTIKRDAIPNYSLDASYIVEPGIGYVKISRFAQTTAKELQDALKELSDKGMVDLILDLQGNGGGYLNAAIDVANEFLQQKQLIVYTLGRTESRSNFLARGNGKFKSGKLVVMVDEYSASASEIVSGAIQDWDRGVLVGRRTFGKGLVQRPINLPDESMIRLTVARYYTPSGRCIQKPYTRIAGQDAREVDLEDYHMDLIERYNRGELLHEDSIHFPDSLAFKTNRLGRTVYGGGGIMPDYFVPMDTLRYTEYHSALVSSGALNQTVTHYIDKNRKALEKKYKDFQSYDEKFEITDEMLSELVKEGEKSSVTYNEEDFLKSRLLISLQMKALIARDLWNTSSYYQVMNRINSSYQKAIEVLNTSLYNGLLEK